MNREVVIRLEPAGRRLVAAPGASLQDLLFEQGVEFPCGGQGTCGKCRVRVIDGHVDPAPLDVELLGDDAVAAGWRLACQSSVAHDATLLLAQWHEQVLADDTPIAVAPREGWGVAIDLGTTTIAAQLVDLAAGTVLGVRSGLNPQVAFGADVMSRIHYAVVEGGAARLRKMVRRYLGGLVHELLEEALPAGRPAPPLWEVIIVGNTVMHHLFAGHDVASLARCPFQTSQPEEAVFSPAELDWRLPDSCEIRFLPCLGGFVGSDVLVGVLAAGLDGAGGLRALVDLGTNGEVVVTDGHALLCAATAAGPAFEGARIRLGMRAASGAIDHVTIAETNAERSLRCHVLGGIAPQGVCGSGLIDAASCALELGLLAANGRLTGGADRLPLAGRVALHQCDLRELQLAKGAIAAGIELLLRRLGARAEQVSQLYLCGAFGNYLNVHHARRVGLLPLPADRICTMGNTALLGAKLVLLGGDNVRARLEAVCRRMEHVSLNEDPAFMEVYVDHMSFPPSDECPTAG